MPDALASFPEWFSLPLDQWVDALVAWLKENAQFVFDWVLARLRAILNPLAAFLTWLPWSVTTVLFAVVAWALRGWRVALGVVAGLLFLGSLGLWTLSMTTLALVLTATVVCVGVGIPAGVLMARSTVMNRALRPVLDFMQTMPSFVYLIPAVMFMGIGPVPALIAVIIFAIPPVIRLTNLGIRNVPAETVEAGTAFGATSAQLLRKVQLPLGFPTLMAGVNQTIMMALSMVIIAALIDAGGLGREVLTGLARLDIGRAFSGGMGIVVLAIIVDRISEGAAHIGTRRRRRGAARHAPREEDPEAGSERAEAASATGAPQPAEPAEPAEPPAPATPAAPQILAVGVTKVFGPHPQAARRLLSEGVSREEILSRTNSTVAVDDVSLEVYPGETFVIMGLSGSGKSTLVRCLNRLIEPTAGTVTIDGDDVGAMGREELRKLRRRKLGMVFQRFSLLPHRSVLDNVCLGLEVQGVGRQERERAGERVLEVVGLAGWQDSFPDQLSGGMQQRVGLARALASDPDILLMDEPFSALDPLMRRQLQEELLQVQARLRKTIVFITHDLDEALKVGDRIAIMKDGRFVQVGTPAEIVLHPADDYVAAFVEGHDKSTMLTARDLMFRPESVARQTEPPRLALRRMERESISSAFVVDSDKRILGVLTAEAAVEAVQQDLPDVGACTLQPVASVSPEDPMRDLISLAVTERYPIAVVDSHARLLGIVARVSILRGLLDDGGGAPATAAAEAQTVG
jgi:glycine betaine/proline transport system ATP-binding protein